MKDVYLDFEMNTDSDVRSKRKDFSIISVGAIIKDRTNGEVTEFHTYVQPVNGKSIYPRITELTGITDADVADAPNINVALGMLFATIDYGVLCTFYTWGDFDRFALKWSLERLGKARQHRDFLWHIIDLSQEIVRDWKLSRTPGLQVMCNICDIQSGDKHDALADARMLCAIHEKSDKLSPEAIKDAYEYVIYTSAHRTLCTAKRGLKETWYSFEQIAKEVAEDKPPISFKEFCSTEVTK